MLVWSYIYANTNNGYGEVDVPILCSKFKVSKTTLRRIVLYGVKTDNGFNVVSKWHDNKLIISIDGALGGTEVVSEWFVQQSKSKPKSKKKKNKKPPTKLYSKMIELYDEFIKSKTNMGAKLNAVEGKAMKSIIQYLRGQVQAKGELMGENDIEYKTLQSWEIILNNWDVLSGWKKENLKLTQIDSNLINIISEIKNNKSNLKTNKKDDKYRQAFNQLDSF
jgi:hypothetical protein